MGSPHSSVKLRKMTGVNGLRLLLQPTLFGDPCLSRGTDHVGWGDYSARVGRADRAIASDFCPGPGNRADVQEKTNFAGSWWGTCKDLKTFEVNWGPSTRFADWCRGRVAVLWCPGRRR